MTQYEAISLGVAAVAVVVSFIGLLMSRNANRKVRALELKKMRDDVMPRFRNFSSGSMRGNLKLYWENDGQEARVVSIVQKKEGQLLLRTAQPPWNIPEDKTMQLEFEPADGVELESVEVHITVEFLDRLEHRYRLTITGTGHKCRSELTWL